MAIYLFSSFQCSWGRGEWGTSDLLRAGVRAQGGARVHLGGFGDGGRSCHTWVWDLWGRETALGQEADLGARPCPSLAV